MSTVRQKLKKSLKGYTNFIALALVNAENYQKTNLEILKHFTKEKAIPGIYVTLNKPFKTMQTILQKNKVDTKMIIFIDAITRLAGGKEKKREERCIYLDSPKDLSDISIAMSEAVNSIKSKRRFIFLDSLSTLLIYNQAGTIAKFMHFLTGKMRKWEVESIIISLERETSKELIDELTQFCDITIRFDKK